MGFEGFSGFHIVFPSFIFVFNLMKLLIKVGMERS